MRTQQWSECVCVHGGFLYLAMFENDTSVARDSTISFLGLGGDFITDMDLQIPPNSSITIRRAPEGTTNLFVDILDTNPMNPNQTRSCGMEVTFGQRVLLSQVIEHGDCGPYA